MPRLLLAPMEGLVDAVMRDVLTQAASYDWCVTEFVRISNTVLPARVFHRVAPELRNASRTEAGVPVRVQLLGSDPQRMGATADVVARLQPAGVDLNCGCPAPLVNQHGGGSILLDTPDCLLQITRAVAQALAGRNTVTYAGGVPSGQNKAPIMASGTRCRMRWVTVGRMAPSST